jgi:Asp-tRNA(Asn)/Glu-tRNA(Gln) amidotransferase A subunit family amidase
MNRRELIALCSGAGIASPLFPGALLGLMMVPVPAAAQTQKAYEHDASPAITPEMVAAAEGIAGIQLTAEQRTMLLDGVRGQRDGVKQIRSMKIPSNVAPAMVFDPRPDGFTVAAASKEPMRMSAAPDVSSLAKNEESLPFATVRELAELLRTRRISSVVLTKMYLERLRRYDLRLHFVVTYTEDRALAQAAQADREIAAGRYRGPLHGVPWGAKDLLNVKGYRTTWGAGGMEQQSFDNDATIVQRLDAAGAVLLAKLTLGALAMGDVWFGGRTRNPWNTKQGSSGSSAGSASAVSAGCVGFAIGSETLGSISSPSARCGVTGFRPSYGLVPKTGAMPLSWSMDKLGPICRSVEDCALVLQAVHGADGFDHSVRNDVHFRWDADFDWKTLRVGYNTSKFELAGPDDLSPKPSKADEMKGWLGEKAIFDTKQYDNRYDRATLEVLKQMGVKLIPVKMPNLPWNAMTAVLEAEAAASFDELTRSGRDALLTAQSKNDWPNTFRVARFLSAVDYIQAQRARSLGIAMMQKVFADVDVIVTPTGGTQSRITNLTGQPSITVPNGLRGEDAPVPAVSDDGADENIGGPRTMTSITFLGGLYDDARLGAFARAYQEHTGFHKLHPPL